MMLVSLSAIGSQQAAATTCTNNAIAQFLDYVATHRNDGILYCVSGMHFAAHSGARFNNESQGHSQNRAHIEDDDCPRWKGALLTLVSIMKPVYALAAKTELAALYVTAKTMVPIHQSLIEMGWPQGRSAIQPGNSTANDVIMTNVPQNLKAMHLSLHWLRYSEAHDQFWIYWAPGVNNWGDYSTKHHPPIYHQSKHNQYAGNLSTKLGAVSP